MISETHPHRQELAPRIVIFVTMLLMQRSFLKLNKFRIGGKLTYLLDVPIVILKKEPLKEHELLFLAEPPP